MKIKQLSLALAAAGLLTGTASVQAGEIEELKAMLLKMQARIEQLEAKQNAATAPAAAPATAVAPAPVPAAAQAVPAAAPANVVVAGDLPGSIKVPGTDTSLKIYGYAQLDATHDFKGRTGDISNNDYASALFVQPFDNSAAGKRNGQTFLTARTSRLGIMSSTPTSMGPLTVKIEGDFGAPNQFQGEIASNSTTFRMRHAYGELGNWIVGQSWSNFLDLRSYPETVDFNPPGSVGLIRQPQVRYTTNLSGLALSASVENPESLTYFGQSASDFDQTPDFTFRIAKGGDWGHISAQAVTLQYRNDEDSERGFGLGFSGSFMLGKDTLAWSVQGGDGIGRYMFNSLLQGGTDVGTEIQTWKALGWNLGYTHIWNPSVRSNLVLSQTHFSANAAANAAQRAIGSEDLYPNRRIEQYSINTFWGIAKNAELGFEYAYGQRKTFNDEVGTQSRLNATARYSFY
jgi:hypothetical protein